MPKSQKNSLKASRDTPCSKTPYMRMTKNSNKEWEEIRCPTCMEHPHNPVLVLCSSHKKGCRPYMCDTESVLSNCLKQFKSSKSATTCPLCRGEIKGYTNVSDEACNYMNSKSRSCSQEDCNFNGTYMELVKHGKRHHVDEGQSEAEQKRWCEWEKLEREREYGNVVHLTLLHYFGEDMVYSRVTALPTEQLIMHHYSVYVIENIRYEIRFFSSASPIEGDSDNMQTSLESGRLFLSIRRAQ